MVSFGVGNGTCSIGRQRATERPLDAFTVLTDFRFCVNVQDACSTFMIKRIKTKQKRYLQNWLSWRKT